MSCSIEIEKVNNKTDALICNELLEKLIQSERAFNNNIKSKYEVKNWFENVFNENYNAIFIAKDNEKIIGYIYIQITSFELGPMQNKEALIDGLFVESEYRGRGISKILMQSAEKWAKEMGVKFIYVNVLENNIKAKKLYESTGYNNFELKLKKEI